MNYDDYAKTHMASMESGLRLVAEEYGQQRQFYAAVRTLLQAKGEPNAWATILERRYGAGRAHSLAKAAVSAVNASDAWFENDGQVLSHSFLQSIADESLLDAAKKYATFLPEMALHSARVLSGAVADTATEGDPRAATCVQVDEESMVTRTPCGLVVLTEEAVRLSKGVISELVDREVRKAVLTSTNAAFLGTLTMTPVGATTAGAVSDLEIGLAAAADSEGYVVAASPAVVRELAMAADGRMGIRGGEYIRGVHVVAIPGATSMTIIPASQLVLQDFGLRVAVSQDAAVQMDDDPASGAQNMVSMFQTNSVALLVERKFRVYANANAIEVS